MSCKMLEVIAEQVKPEFRNEVHQFFKGTMPKYQEFVSKHGGKFIGSFETLSGGQAITEFVFVIGWPDVAARQACFMDMMGDDYMREKFKECSKYFIGKQQWVGESFDESAFPEQLDDSGPVLMATADVKGNAFEAASHLKHHWDTVHKEIGLDLPISALLVPTTVFSTYSLQVFAKTDEDKFKNIYPTASKFMRNPDNWKKHNQIYSVISPQQKRLLMPLRLMPEF